MHKLIASAGHADPGKERFREDNLREVGVPSRNILHGRGRRSKFRIRVAGRLAPRPPKR